MTHFGAVKALVVCVLVLFGASLAATVETGHACTCAVSDPRTALVWGEAAFVGNLRSRREVAGGSILVFNVEKLVKGRL